MKEKKRIGGKIVAILELLAGAALLAAVKLWAPACSGLLALADGGQTHMKCFYSGQALVLLGILLAVNGLCLLAGSLLQGGCMSIVIGVLIFIVPGSSPLGIGICANAAMACHMMAAWARLCAGAAVLLGAAAVFLAVRQKK